jgi:hypothetical protein
LGTYSLLQHREEPLALVRAEDALVLQEMPDNHLLHGLLPGPDLIEFGLDDFPIRRVGRYRVNHVEVQADNAVSDAVDAADEAVPAGNHASSLIIVQAHFLVCKRRTSRKHLIGVRSDKRHIERDRKDYAESSDVMFHREVSKYAEAIGAPDASPTHAISLPVRLGAAEVAELSTKPIRQATSAVPAAANRIATGQGFQNSKMPQLLRDLASCFRTRAMTPSARSPGRGGTISASRDAESVWSARNSCWQPAQP